MAIEQVNLKKNSGILNLADLRSVKECIYFIYQLLRIDVYTIFKEKFCRAAEFYFFINPSIFKQ